MKNTLIQYRGGGYNGCYWEWNFFYFDKNGKFYNILSTGRNGVKDEKDAARLLAANENSTYFYRITTKKARKEFVRENNPFLVAKIIHWLGENTKLCLSWPCDNCGIFCFAANLIGTGERLLCCDCMSTFSCGNCGEIFESRNQLIDTLQQAQKEFPEVPEDLLNKIIENFAPICYYCFERRVEFELENKIRYWNNLWYKDRLVV